MRAFLILSVLLAAGVSGAIVDRIAVVVGDKVVTDSDIALRIRLSAFQNDQAAEFTPAARAQAAQQLVDQKLVEHEMDLGHYPRLEKAARQALLDAWAKTNYKSDAKAMEKALAAYELTPQDLEDELARQSDLLTFLNLRLRPALLGNDSDQTSLDQRTQNELDRWLQDQYRRTRIEYVEKELASKGSTK